GVAHQQCLTGDRFAFDRRSDRDSTAGRRSARRRTGPDFEARERLTVAVDRGRDLFPTAGRGVADQSDPGAPDLSRRLLRRGPKQAGSSGRAAFENRFGDEPPRRRCGPSGVVVAEQNRQSPDQAGEGKEPDGSLAASKVAAHRRTPPGAAWTWK